MPLLYGGVFCLLWCCLLQNFVEKKALIAEQERLLRLPEEDRKYELKRNRLIEYYDSLIDDERIILENKKQKLDNNENISVSEKIEMYVKLYDKLRQLRREKEVTLDDLEKEFFELKGYKHRKSEM